ncbi:uncharacterized protein LOC106661643 isoform X2 [Cimex lectularius]|uniref:F-box domain-containing protein n=1 Tax=Cimex lectularius TaxID=79782 RepID=A0A8I6RDY5_CIMLE|nr:uncharacterized protein LOC106661643 isoform X2 [Cimex lectularius]
MVVVRVNLAELPIEILEQIVAELDPDEVVTSVSKISTKFATIAYRVMRKEFRKLAPMIESQLNATKTRISASAGDPRSLQAEMKEVANFTFLQIMKSEYNIICTIYFEENSLSQSTLVFKAVKSLQEFQRLLKGSENSSINIKDDNVSSLMNELRTINSELLSYFFVHTWDMEKDHMGLLILKFLNCSLCSNSCVRISYEQTPKYKDSRCYINFSNTVVPPPLGLQQMPQNEARRALASYICETIRWGNLFHTLRLRWICMDRALAMGRRQYPGWPLLDAKNVYISGPPKVNVREEVKEVRKGEMKVLRYIDKRMEQMNLDSDNWVGTRVDFQLWCLSEEAPPDMFPEAYLAKLGELPEMDLNENTDSGAYLVPYRFLMEYKVYSAAQSTHNNSLAQSTIWLQETAGSTKIIQSRQLLAA